MISLKIHNDGIVSLCDKELIGKTFEEGDMQLNVSERFYNGKEASKEEIVQALKGAKTINIVGEKSVALALEAGVITEDSVKKIKGIPHAQVFTV